MLRNQAAITVEAMDALVAWSNGDTAAADSVRDCEHRADTTERELWEAVRDSFSPPLDAEDVYTLSADLDEVLNAAKDLVREMEVMNIEPDAPTHEMVTLLADAVVHLADAFRCLRTEEDATPVCRCRDQMPAPGRARVPAGDVGAAPGPGPARGDRAPRGIRRLSRIGDLVHTVAERVWYSVVKEA